MISVKGFRRKHDLPPPSGDLSFPSNVMGKDAKRLSEKPKAYVEEFDKLNGFKPVDYTCFNQQEPGL